MTRMASKLVWLRWLFVVYLLAVAGIDVFFSLSKLSAQSLRLEHLEMTPSVIITISCVTYGMVFGVVWLLFHLLQRKKRWARIVLLVISWVVVFDAVTSFLFTAEVAVLGRWLRHLSPGVDWEQLVMLDRIKDFLGLLYFGFAIYVLQIDSEVKKGLEAR